ncbi:MAG: hypothetical protein ACTHLU_04290 [Novosphingobium sp.]
MGTTSAVTAQPLRYVVFDSRLRQSSEFARYLVSQGAEPLDIAGGLTRLWQNSLVPHWRDGSGFVAGLTTRTVWDGLSQQAMHQFRRPAKIGAHRIDVDTGLAAHRVCETMLDSIGGCADHDWPRRMALAVNVCAARSARNPRLVPTDQAARVPGACLHLATWMIG